MIIPAYNEEQNIARVIKSLIDQTQKPELLVIVDDGSTDKTAEIVLNFKRRYHWINLVTNHDKQSRSIGSKIVEAFDLGLANIHLQSFDLVSKFDADLEFPADYIERIQEYFKLDDKLGLVGGICNIYDGKWISEGLTNLDHVRGALKTYRVSAFVEMEGLRKSMGWDSADEFILRYHGWAIKVVSDLSVRHYRETNHHIGWRKSAQLNAEVFHKLRYGFFIGTLSCLKRIIKFKPFLVNGLYTTWWFYVLYFKGVQPIVSEKVGEFIRRYRVANIKFK